MLRQLKAVGEKLVAAASAEAPELTFRMGFHSMPSTGHLHMYVPLCFAAYLQRPSVV
jgi:hypothetical protein